MTERATILELAGPAYPVPAAVNGRWRTLVHRHLFALVVLLPTALSAVYFTAIASDRYVSESRFLVRSVDQPVSDGFTALLRTFGLTDADDPAYAVQSYMISRDALRDLSAELPMRSLLAPEGVDPLSACFDLRSGDSFETLYRCFQRRVRVLRDAESGISRLEVDLYRPEDSQAVAAGLLQLAEALANRMNRRAEADALEGLEAARASAERRTRAAQDALTDFRNAAGLLDIGASAAAGAALTSGLAGELTRLKAEIERQEALSPDGPALPSLKVRAQALQTQMTGEMERMVGGADALAGRLPAYEALVLDKEMAAQSWRRAAEALDRARADAQRQNIYLDRIVEPNRPDAAIRPRRLRMIASVVVVSFALFAMIWLVVTGAREHADQAW